MSLKDKPPVVEPLSNQQIFANLTALAQIDDYQHRQPPQPQPAYARQFSFPPEAPNSIPMFGRTNSVNYGGPWIRNGWFILLSIIQVKSLELVKKDPVARSFIK